MVTPILHPFQSTLLGVAVVYFYCTANGGKVIYFFAQKEGEGVAGNPSKDVQLGLPVLISICLLHALLVYRTGRKGELVEPEQQKMYIHCLLLNDDPVPKPELLFPNREGSGEQVLRGAAQAEKPQLPQLVSLICGDLVHCADCLCTQTYAPIA